MLGGKLDGGIPRYASAEFVDWVEEIKRNLGEKPITFDSLTQARVKELSTLPERLVQAMAASEKKHDVYLFERDWAEFDAVGREPAGLDDPAVYFPALCIRSQKIGWDEALTEFDGIVKALGKDNVLRAIQQVHAAPRVRFGVLKVTAPEPVKTTPSGTKVPDPTVPMPEGVIGVYADAIRAIKILATKDDARRYLLYLLTYQNQPKPLVSKAATQWAFAETAYNRLLIAFGEQEVLQTAHSVRTATKRMTSGTVMDQQAIGATRNEPWEAFEDILSRKDPRGYVRSALIFSENLDSPAATDVAYKKLVSTSDEAAVLEAARKMAAEKPHFAYKDELEYLKKVLNGSLTFEKPADTFVDYPEYRVWKAFAPGAKVTYASRVLQPERYGSDHFIPGQLKDRHAYLLQSINDDQAQLWFTETIYDANGTAHPPRDTEIAYPAKYAQPAAPAAAPAQSGEEPTAPRGKGSAARTRQSATTTATALVPGRLLRYTMPASAPIESGEETIEINAKRIATRWQSVSYSFNASSPYKDCSLIVKVWTSDQVPSGLVRKTEDKTCPGDKNHPSTRFIEETILESAECNGLNIAAAPDPRNQGPPVIQLSTVKPASATPDAEPAPTKPAPQQTPVPARTPPPRSGARPASLPVPTGQNALMQRYSAVIGRAGRAKVQLAQLERKQAGQGIQLPAEVRDARDRLDAQLKAVIVAMQKRDNDQTEQSLQSFESTVSAIEKYLGQ